MKNTLGLEDNPFDPKTVKPVCRAGQPILMDADPTLRELVCDNLAHFAECEERIRGALYQVAWAVTHGGADSQKVKAWMAVGGPAVSSTAMTRWADGSLAVMVGVSGRYMNTAAAPAPR
jgi:hypothetical protein